MPAADTDLPTIAPGLPNTPASRPIRRARVQPLDPHEDPTSNTTELASRRSTADQGPVPIGYDDQRTGRCESLHRVRDQLDDDRTVPGLVPDRRPFLGRGPGLPVPRLSAPRPDTVACYALTKIDDRGRLADRSLIRALGWGPGHRVQLAVAEGAVLAVSSAEGRDAINGQGHLRLPAAVRRSCDLEPGDQVMAGTSERGHARTVSGEPALQRRPGWVRDVAVPRDSSELRGPMTGRVRLPLRLFWSGPAPEQVEWDLSRQSRRGRLYELVLREGTLADIRQLVDGSELVRLWDSLWLPPHVHAAWQPLIDAARHAA
jgi:hypothetical protein